MPTRVVDEFQQAEMDFYNTKQLNPDQMMVEQLFRNCATSESPEFLSSEEIYGSKKTGFVCKFCGDPNVTVVPEQKRSPDEPSTFAFQCRKDHSHRWVSG